MLPFYCFDHLGPESSHYKLESMGKRKMNTSTKNVKMGQKNSNPSKNIDKNSKNIKQIGTGKTVDPKNVKDVCVFTWVDAAAKKAARNEPG